MKATTFCALYEGGWKTNGINVFCRGWRSLAKWGRTRNLIRCRSIGTTREKFSGMRFRSNGVNLILMDNGWDGNKGLISIERPFDSSAAFLYLGAGPPNVAFPHSDTTTKQNLPGISFTPAASDDESSGLFISAIECDLKRPNQKLRGRSPASITTIATLKINRSNRFFCPSVSLPSPPSNSNSSCNISGAILFFRQS